jgi:hypothetical protein
LQVIVPAARPGRRSSEGVEQTGTSLVENVKKNPGQREEQNAESLRTDTKTMRLPMRRLIADRAVRRKGERRAMRYYPA